jgi:hypothetical protein
VNFEEAAQDNRRIYAMDEEIWSIDRSNTRELGSLPKGHKAIGVKWVYKQRRMSKEKLKDTRQN